MTPDARPAAPSTPRFFVERLDAPQVLLLPADTRHAMRSLRLAMDDELLLGDGKGRVGRGRLAGVRGDRAVIDVLETAAVPRPTPAVSVALAPPANEGYRWAVQKLVELGVDELFVMRAERSTRRVDDEGVGAKLQLVAREAAMQCRRAYHLELAGTGSLSNAVGGGGAAVVLDEHAPVRLRDVLPDATDAIRVLVGPEGGFTDAEVCRAREGGAAVASLGPTTLRAETAAVAGAAVVLHRYGRLG